MFRKVVTFVFALTMSLLNLTGNSYKSHAAENRYQKAPVNIIIPDDVMSEFLSAPQTIKEKHCSAKNNYPYLEISHLIKNIIFEINIL